jgi:hypothetical protein
VRLMREDNLLCLRKPAFRPATTDGRHDWRLWPDLARRLVPMTVNQLWVADITYVRLDEAFVYLAVMLDAFSRKVIGPPRSADRGRFADGSAVLLAADGRWPIIFGPSWRSRRCRWHWTAARWLRAAWCITPIAGCSTPAATTSPVWRSTASNPA